MIWAQDHDDVLPPEGDVWGGINIDHNVLKCPSFSAEPIGYVYSAFVASKRLAALKDTLTTIVTADGMHQAAQGTYNNGGYGPGDLAYRHASEVVVSFADGHALGTSDPRDLTIEFRDAPAAEFNGNDITILGNFWSTTPQFHADSTVASQFRIGAKGYVLCNWNGVDPTTNVGAANVDTYVDSVTQTGFTGVSWAAAPGGDNDQRALPNPATNGTRAGSGWTGNGKITITLKPNADPALFNAIHTVHIYCVDWDHQSRTMHLNVNEGTSDNSLMKKDVPVNGFGDGVWVSFRFRGNINITTKCIHGPNAVISALAFD